MLRMAYRTHWIVQRCAFVPPWLPPLRNRAAAVGGTRGRTTRSTPGAVDARLPLAVTIDLATTCRAAHSHAGFRSRPSASERIRLDEVSLLSLGMAGCDADHTSIAAADSYWPGRITPSAPCRSLVVGGQLLGLAVLPVMFPPSPCTYAPDRGLCSESGPRCDDRPYVREPANRPLTERLLG